MELHHLTLGGKGPEDETRADGEGTAGLEKNGDVSFSEKTLGTPLGAIFDHFLTGSVIRSSIAS